MINTDMKRNLIIAGFLTLFLASFVRSSLAVALPNTIATDLQLSPLDVTLIPLLYLLVNAVLYVPFGRIGDIYGRKRIFQYGLIIFTISSFLCAVSVSWEMFIFIRIFQSIGNAMIFTSLYALISSSFVSDKRGGAFGLTIMGFSIGLIVGFIFGGLATQMMGWRSIFIFDAIVGVLATLIIIRFKQDWNEAKSEKFDIVGSIIFGLSIMLIILGFSAIAKFYGLFAMILGVIGLLLFYFVQKRSDYPLINLDLFKSKSFSFGIITSMINYSTFIAVTYVLSQYLINIMGFEPIKSGLLLSVSAVVMFIVSPFAGKLSDKFNPGNVSTVGLFFITMGIAIMATFNENTSLILILSSLIVFGLGNGLFFPSNTKYVISTADKKYFGVASATLSDTRAMGQALGVGIFFLVISTFSENFNLASADISLKSADPVVLLMSIKVSLFILSILSVIGILTSLINDKK